MDSWDALKKGMDGTKVKSNIRRTTRANKRRF